MAVVKEELLAELEREVAVDQLLYAVVVVQLVVEKNQKIAEDTAVNIRSYLYGMGLKNLLDHDNNVHTLVYGNLTLELPLATAQISSSRSCSWGKSPRPLTKSSTSIRS